MFNFLSEKTIEQHTNALANFLPNGELFVAKMIDGSIMRLLLRGLATAQKELDDLIVLFSQELDISTTTYLLEAWEKSVGIPDSCFSTDGKTLDERRRNVLIKLTALGVQTAADFIALGAMFGIVVTVETGDNNTIGWTDPDPVVERHTLIILFTDNATDSFETVPPSATYEGLEFHTAPPFAFTGFRFGSTGYATMLCLFQKLKPANVQLIFERV